MTWDIDDVQTDPITRFVIKLMRGVSDYKQGN